MKKALLALLAAAGLSSCTLETVTVGVTEPSYYMPTRTYYVTPRTYYPPARTYIYSDLRPDYIRYRDPWATRRHRHCRR